MKQYIKCTTSYADMFWRLHDRDMETGVALEDIVDDAELTDLFFPEEGEPEADEDDYKYVLSQFERAGGPSATVEDVLNRVYQDLKTYQDIKHVQYEDSIQCVRFTLKDGRTYQLCLQHVR